MGAAGFVAFGHVAWTSFLASGIWTEAPQLADSCKAVLLVFSKRDSKPRGSLRMTCYFMGVQAQILKKDQARLVRLGRGGSVVSTVLQMSDAAAKRRKPKNAFKVCTHLSAFSAPLASINCRYVQPLLDRIKARRGTGAITAPGAAGEGAAAAGGAAAAAAVAPGATGADAGATPAAVAPGVTGVGAAAAPGAPTAAAGALGGGGTGGPSGSGEAGDERGGLGEAEEGQEGGGRAGCCQQQNELTADHMRDLILEASKRWLGRGA